MAPPIEAPSFPRRKESTTVVGKRELGCLSKGNFRPPDTAPCRGKRFRFRRRAACASTDLASVEARLAASAVAFRHVATDARSVGARVTPEPCFFKEQPSGTLPPAEGRWGEARHRSMFLPSIRPPHPRFSRGTSSHVRSRELMNRKRHWVFLDQRPAAATTFLAASVSPSAAMMSTPLWARILFPSSTSVPSRRTTSGTLKPAVL